jgi:hypothetical protein
MKIKRYAVHEKKNNISSYLDSGVPEENVSVENKIEDDIESIFSIS